MSVRELAMALVNFCNKRFCCVYFPRVLIIFIFRAPNW